MNAVQPNDDLPSPDEVEGFDNFDDLIPPFIPTHVHPLRNRRPCWTPGAAVTLVDGREWHLPILTPAIIATIPGLAVAIQEVWATACQETPDEREAHFKALHQCARLMIRSNYDLRFEPPTPPVVWNEAMADQMEDITVGYLMNPITWDFAESYAIARRIAEVVSEAINAADPMLRVYLKTLRPGRRHHFDN